MLYSVTGKQFVNLSPKIRSNGNNKDFDIPR